jgi:hypothetical protein
LQEAVVRKREPRQKTRHQQPRQIGSASASPWRSQRRRTARTDARFCPRCRDRIPGRKV